jgi:predicted  nucleic acid-binding Zn-ribbon protein
MSQPEISIRCSSCGAAVREPAMFCPECGKPLATAAAETELPAEIAKPNLASSTNAAPVADEEAQAAPASVEDAGATVDPETREIKTITPEEPVSPHGARERTRERLHRASSVARGALEGNVKRVEKIHHVSTAMFEEATYDPSLRFVLVALGLFIVAIILLVLSKVMG